MPYENEAMRKAAKTWGGDFYKMGGGGSVWDGMAYDPEADLIYVGTGNAEPWVQKFRGAQERGQPLHRVHSGREGIHRRAASGTTRRSPTTTGITTTFSS